MRWIFLENIHSIFFHVHDSVEHAQYLLIPQSSIILWFQSAWKDSFLDQSKPDYVFVPLSLWCSSSPEHLMLLRKICFVAHRDTDPHESWEHPAFIKTNGIDYFLVTSIEKCQRNFLRDLSGYRVSIDPKVIIANTGSSSSVWLRYMVLFSEEKRRRKVEQAASTFNQAESPFFVDVMLSSHALKVLILHTSFIDSMLLPNSKESFFSIISFDVASLSASHNDSK